MLRVYYRMYYNTSMSRERQRNILTFEPIGASAAIIRAELNNRRKRKERGALRRLLEEAVIAHLGPKYPKLMQIKESK